MSACAILPIRIPGKGAASVVFFGTSCFFETSCFFGSSCFFGQIFFGTSPRPPDGYTLYLNKISQAIILSGPALFRSLINRV